MSKKKQSAKELEKLFLQDLEKESGITSKPLSKKDLEKEFLRDLEEISAPTKKEKNAAYQRIYRLQNKIDKKGISLKEKRVAEKALTKEKSLIGYKGLTQRENTRYNNEKKSLVAKRRTLLRKFKAKSTSQKDKNKLAKDIMQVSGRIIELNKKLSVKQPAIPKKREKAKTTKQGDIINQVPPWLMKADYIDPSIRDGFMNTYIIDGIKINKSNPVGIYMAYQDFYAKMLLKGSNGMVIIIQSARSKSIEIKEAL